MKAATHSSFSLVQGTFLLLSFIKYIYNITVIVSITILVEHSLMLVYVRLFEEHLSDNRSVCTMYLIVY